MITKTKLKVPCKMSINSNSILIHLLKIFNNN